MKITKLCFYLFLIIGTHPAFARPISYPDGWMLMMENDVSRNAVELDYTITPKLAFGARSEYARDGNYQLHTLTMNNRLFRANLPDSQGNIFMMSGLGYAGKNNSSNDDIAAFTGIEADWEDRRYFINYQNKYIYAGDIDKNYSQSMRVGIAPYIGEAGDLHTWFMIQTDHRPKSDDNFEVTPLIRLFKDTHLVEMGFSNQGNFLFNYTHQF